MSDAYPLATLMRLREDTLDAARRAHADTLRARDMAQQVARERQQMLEAHDQQTHASRGQPTSAAEAQTLHAWILRRRDEASQLRRHLDEARAEARAREADEAAAQDKLRDALREKQVADAHHTRWLEHAQRTAEKNEEHESEERR